MSKVIKHSPPPPPRNLFPFLPISRHDGERKTSGYDFSRGPVWFLPEFLFFLPSLETLLVFLSANVATPSPFVAFISPRQGNEQFTTWSKFRPSPRSGVCSRNQGLGEEGGKKKRYFEIFGSKYVRYISRLIIDLLFFVSLYKSLWYEIYIVKIN